MAELGGTSRSSHEDIGEYAARVSDSGLAGLIAVGEEAAPLLEGARRVRSWPGEALAVADGAAALDLLANRLKPGDVVLVKASRAAGLERVAEVLAQGDAPAGLTQGDPCVRTPLGRDPSPRIPRGEAVR